MAKANAITAERVLSMLTAHQALINHEDSYPHIKPFKLVEVTDFLAGKPGKDVSGRCGKFKWTSTRSRQINQAVSVIGSRLVDAKKADAETKRVYKALWEIESSCTCQYCKKPYRFNFMFGSGNGVCPKARCQLQNMRDNI